MIWHIEVEIFKSRKYLRIMMENILGLIEAYYQIKELIEMKVKIVCQRDYETKEVDLPMDEEALLKVQGSVLDRNTVGYITGAEVKYYDEQENEIENIFILNKQLQS